MTASTAQMLASLVSSPVVEDVFSTESLSATLARIQDTQDIQDVQDDEGSSAQKTSDFSEEEEEEFALPPMLLRSESDCDQGAMQAALNSLLALKQTDAPITKAAAPAVPAPAAPVQQQVFQQVPVQLAQMPVQVPVQQVVDQQQIWQAQLQHAQFQQQQQQQTLLLQQQLQQQQQQQQQAMSPYQMLAVQQMQLQALLQQQQQQQQAQPSQTVSNASLAMSMSSNSSNSSAPPQQQQQQPQAAGKKGELSVADQARLDRTIHLMGIDSAQPLNTLIKLVSQCGRRPVKMFRLCGDVSERRTTRYSFIEMEHRHDALEAVQQLHFMSFGANFLQCSMARSPIYRM